jgi:hypothetical protein
MLYGTATYAQQPIWQQFPKLICHSERTKICTADDKCDEVPGNYIYSVDFPAGTVHATSATGVSKIISRIYSGPGGGIPYGSSSIVTDFHATMTFMPAKTPPNGAAEVPAIWQSALYGIAMNLWLTCNPT